MNIKSIFFLFIALHSQIFVCADIPTNFSAIPKELQINSLIWGPFFNKQHNKLCTNTIKHNELVDTILLAFQVEDSNFLAAVEMQRFIHNPQLIEKIATQEAVLLIDLLKARWDPSFFSLLNHNILSCLTTGKSSFSLKKPLCMSTYMLNAGPHINEESITLTFDNTKQLFIIRINDNQTRVIDRITETTYGGPIEVITEFTGVPFKPVKSFESGAHIIPQDIIAGHYGLSIFAKEPTSYFWEPERDEICSLVNDFDNDSASIYIFPLNCYRTKNYIHQLILCSMIGFLNLTETHASWSHKSINNIAKSLKKCIQANQELSGNTKEELMESISNIHNQLLNC